MNYNEGGKIGKKKSFVARALNAVYTRTRTNRGETVGVRYVREKVIDPFDFIAFVFWELKEGKKLYNIPSEISPFKSSLGMTTRKTLVCHLHGRIKTYN